MIRTLLSKGDATWCISRPPFATCTREPSICELNDLKSLKRVSYRHIRWSSSLLYNSARQVWGAILPSCNNARRGNRYAGSGSPRWYTIYPSTYRAKWLLNLALGARSRWLRYASPSRKRDIFCLSQSHGPRLVHRVTRVIKQAR